jgi:hypothetical protein
MGANKVQSMGVGPAKLVVYMIGAASRHLQGSSQNMEWIDRGSKSSWGWPFNEE